MSGRIFWCFGCFGLLAFDLKNQKALRNTDKTDDHLLIALFKLLSPEHLLKLPFSNDSNNLDKRFYSELLHIIGLAETKEEIKFKKVIGGKNISKWIIKWDGKYINYGNHLACPRDNKIFEQPKILIREAGNKIIATLDKDNYYILSSLYNGILINEEFEIEFIISQLNSKLFQFLLNQLTFEKTKGAFTKARIFHYYELPIKRVDRKAQKPFVEIVNNILQEKNKVLQLIQSDLNPKSTH